MDDITRLRTINRAIWLRDNAAQLGRDKTLELMVELYEEGGFSSRQLSNLVNGTISHQRIARYLNKQSKSGGRLNPATLEDIKKCFEAHQNGTMDIFAIRSVVRNGTSLSMLSKLSGISKSFISRNVK